MNPVSGVTQAAEFVPTSAPTGSCDSSASRQAPRWRPFDAGASTLGSRWDTLGLTQRPAGTLAADIKPSIPVEIDRPPVGAERRGIDRELTVRHSRQLTNRLRRAKLKHDACIEDIDFRHRRGLDKQLVLSLTDGRWIRDHLNVLICGPTGVGKSWIGCALAQSACRNGHSALNVRVSRLLSALAIARADGRYPKLLESLAKTEVPVMD